MVNYLYITTFLIGTIGLIQCQPIEGRQFDSIINGSMSAVTENMPKPPKLPDYQGVIDGFMSSATDIAKGAGKANDGSANNAGGDANNTGGGANNAGGGTNNAGGGTNNAGGGTNNAGGGA